VERKIPPIFFVIVTGMILWILADAVYFGVLEQSRSLPENMYLIVFGTGAAIAFILGIIWIIIRGAVSRFGRDRT
jgi:hypothetical protein